MPNPVVPNNSQFYHNYVAVEEPTRFSYSGPAMSNSGPGGAPVPFCANIQKYYYALRSSRPYNLLRKEGYKHVPYSSLTDNHHPLAYTMLKWSYSRPEVYFNLVDLKHNHSGFPIDCEGKILYDIRMGSGSMPALGAYPIADQQMDNEAIADLNDNLSDQRDITVNWAMTVAERRETISMLDKRLTQLVSVVRNLRRGRFERAHEQLFNKKPARKYRGPRTKDRAASLWLEWTYGWSPFLSDIYNATNDLVKIPRPLILRASGKSAKRDDRVVSTSSAFGGMDVIPNLNYNVSVKSHVGLKYVSYYRVENAKFASAAGAGLTNPALLVWELIPGSFVFDWFGNVGNVLNDITIANGLTHLATVRSEKRTFSARAHSPVKMDYVQSTSFRMKGVGIVDCFEERTEFIRTISPTRPRIYLGLNTQPLSIRRIISSAALLNQLGKGLFTKKRT